MKKIIICILVAAMAVSCTFVCNKTIVRGNGVVVEKEFDFDELSSIAVYGGVDVVYTQGPQSVVLCAEENLLEYYTVDVNGGLLKIAQDKFVTLLPKKNTVLRVSSMDLDGIRLNGAGDCEVKGCLVTDGDFTFSVNGSGDFDADAIRCKNLTVKISGAGDVDIKSATAETITATISGSGDIDIHCKDAGDIVAKINGSGDIDFSGNARSISSKVNGAGNIDYKNLSLN